jgi:hypothetical protein
MTREREVEIEAEEHVNVRSHRKRERYIILGREKEHHFVVRFPGFARSTFDKRRVKVKALELLKQWLERGSAEF